MFLQRLQEEEEEGAGLLNLLFLILVNLSWLEKNTVVLSNRPCPSLRNDLPSKTTWHGKSSSKEVHLIVCV